MAYRPYPNADRALAQVYRHAPADPETPALPALRPLAAAMGQLRERSRRAVEAWPVGEYRLSTRPRIVSGGS
jgi:hypothetical protein